MQDLRLIGVHEDGMHLILGDDEGNRFRVPLDEPLRAVARRDRPRLRPTQAQPGGGQGLRPREVQTMIRAGLSPEEVAELAGWTVEKVHRYEGPILAEREHVAGLAQQVRLRSRGGPHGAAPTLGARVAERLASRHIDAGAARWDARREDKGAWSVVLFFNAGGRQREAAWDFDPLTRTVSATDDEARWLSEDDVVEATGPLPTPHASAPVGPTQVYDVEAEGGVGAPRRREAAEAVDLMTAMRERSASRGRRRRGRASEVPGLEGAPEEALPLEDLVVPTSQAGMPPAAHTHPEDDPDATPTRPAPVEPAAAPAGQDVDVDVDQLEQETVDALASGAPEPVVDDTAYDAEDDGYVLEEDVAHEPAHEPAPPRQPPGRKSGRPSVPSWDDIVFGRKPH
ncbi:MAG TPA: septation protein SepH [Intrasporangium sp.]|uniref:septation protein SepH n=1 Tax=Intrasporangium sp. TaxID=1925024 RepID=UPI002D7A1F9C|nr:septation protein SepH [Intrasporangium sp.]HET7397366.1 septation protein SepH [Intrasporangium sp.]